MKAHPCKVEGRLTFFIIVLFPVGTVAQQKVQRGGGTDDYESIG